MSRFVIQGGRPLSGTHLVPGNKNAALPMLAASLLSSSEPVTLENLPNIADVRVMIEGLKTLGVAVSGSIENHRITLDARRLHATPVVPAEICSKIRTSFLFVGPMLARKRAITLRSAPGGDGIGRRRLDTHVNGLHALGALGGKPRSGSGQVSMRAPKGLIGTYFMLDEASVMATENLLLASVTAKGTTTLYNTACEPHVQNLCHMLCGMGAKIQGIGTNRLTITGVPALHGGTFRVKGDIIEAASYLVASVVTKGALTLKGLDPDEMAVLAPAFRKFGVKWSFDAAGDLRLPARQSLRTAYDLGDAIPKIEDGPWPALPSDLQSVLIVLATQTRGTELFFEKMFESRLYFVDHLIGMGAKIVQCDPHRAVVTGPTKLQGSTVSSPDIRAGMALIIAALCARGTTVIHNAESIDRGYEAVEDNLRALGASITREE